MVTAGAGPAAEAYVQDGHLRAGGGDPREGLPGVARLAHHLDVALRLQEVAHPAADHFVVVEDEDPQRAGWGVLVHAVLALSPGAYRQSVR